jgi:sugar/nucleoside kinase (ribokinase family)
VAAGFDLIGLGHACEDIVAHVDDAFLAGWRLTKGKSHEVPLRDADAIEAELTDPGYHPGGASANTAACIAALGGKAGFAGKVARDRVGERVRADMAASGLSFLACEAASAEDGGSTRVICLTTAYPEPERTFAFYSGVGRTFVPSELDRAALARTRLLHADGHMLTHDGAFATMMAAADTARSAGARFAFTLADQKIVHEFPQLLHQLLERVDILLVNTPEAQAWAGTQDAHDAVRVFQSWGKAGAVTRSGDGCIAFSPHTHVAVPAARLEAPVIDPNGAGDAFAGGFLFGLMQDWPLERAATLGGLCAANVITRLGARVAPDLAHLLRGI